MIRGTGCILIRVLRSAAAANLARDTNFNGTIVGNVYAQPLYIEDGPGGVAMVIAVTAVEQCLCAQRRHWRDHLGTERRHAHNLRSPVRKY